MIVVCDHCDRRYDDARSWTICPHNPLDVRPDDLVCRRCDLVVGYTNILTRSTTPDNCMACGRSREEIEANP